MSTMSNGRWFAAAWLAAGLLAGQTSYADDHDRDRDRGRVERSEGPEVRARVIVRAPAPRGQVFDDRYNHGRYYPPRGYVVRELPGGYHPYYWHGDRYFFAEGAWYAPGPTGFMVVRPPVGLFVNVLPPYYSTVWIGGAPYYYADDVYYRWDAGANGYDVVDAPPDADQPAPPPSPAAGPSTADNFYIYPKNGQSAEQQAADRYECHSWAKGQTGFDPTQPGGGVPPDQTGPQGDQYRRAITACLEARGYSVR